MKPLLPLRLACLALSLSAGCTPPTPRAHPGAKAAADSTVAAYVDVINYNHDRGFVFSLEDLTQPGNPAVGGGLIERLVSGGNVACCISLPAVWKPGIRMKLIWQITTTEKTFDKVEREFEIPRYKEPGNLYVVFYPKSEVELVVSSAEPGHPNWTGRIKQRPWDFCVAQNGPKACKAALPKGFSLEEIRGICAIFQKDKEPDADAICESTIQECIEWYEDPEMCSKLVWEKDVKK